MTKTDLIKLLLSERDYHATHPVDIASKFWYTLGGVLTTLVAGLIFKDKIDFLNYFVENDRSTLYLILGVIAIGYSVMSWAIVEHTKIHKLQLDRIELAIEELFNDNSETIADSFWATHGKVRLKTNKPEDEPVKLFTKEPDTRTGIYFHDRKLEAGIVLTVIGVILFMGCLVSSAREMHAKPKKMAFLIYCKRSSIKWIGQSPSGPLWHASSAG